MSGRGTIGQFCEDLIRTRPELSNRQVMEACRELFPEAKTSVASVAWYRSRLRQMAGRLAPPAETSAVGALITRSAAKSRALWPDWVAPTEADLFRLAQITSRYVRFPEPALVATVVKDTERNRHEWRERLEAVGIDASLYLWDGSPCAFPGVRRYAGSSEIAQYRRRMDVSAPPPQALRLDDNDYPKQFWSFVCTGGPFRKQGPPQYALAHVAEHKVSLRNAMGASATADSRVVPTAAFGLYTSVANTVYIPNDLIRPTDSSVSLRSLIFSQCLKLFGDHCSLLPPGMRMSMTASEKWAAEAFSWPPPVGNLELAPTFLTFRYAEMHRLLALPRSESPQSRQPL